MKNIYIKSCGALPEQDYCWVEEISGGQQRTKPPLIFQEMNDLVEKEAHSIVLFRNNNELSLLISNLEASERVDYQIRKARNSIICIGEESDELALRMLIVYAIEEQEDFKSRLDSAVSASENDPNGFKVYFDVISQWLDSDTSKIIDEPLPPEDEVKRLGKNTSLFTQKLATEIRNYSLPKQEGPLIVVTGYKDKNVLIQAQVWRGLSALIDLEEWEEINDNFNDFIRSNLNELIIKPIKKLVVSVIDISKNW